MLLTWVGCQGCQGDGVIDNIKDVVNNSVPLTPLTPTTPYGANMAINVIGLIVICGP